MFVVKYIFKVLSNVISMILSFIIALFLPNLLGPTDFGKFDYLNSFNDNLKLFFDFNTSTSFYIEISKNNKNYSFFKYYIVHIIFIFLIIIIFLILLLNSNLYNYIFKNIDYYIVIEAFLLGYFVWISDITRKIHDAIGNTNNSELHYISSKILLLILFVMFIYFNKVNLFNIVLINLIASLFLCFYQTYNLLKFYTKTDFFKIYHSKIKEAFVHIFKFSKPLFFYTLVTFLVTFFDRFILLKNNNFDEQAFFGIAFRLSSISFFLISALTQLLIREFVLMENEFNKIQTIFKKKIFYLYSIISVFAVLTTFYSGEIITLIYGNKFFRSVLIFHIISLYPLHQLFGQICAAHYLTKNKTKTYSIVMIVSSLLGMILSYILISKNYLFHLGGSGLAIKTILIQFISTNILFFYICKEYKIIFYKKLALQLILPFILFLFIYLIDFIFNIFIATKYYFIYTSFIYIFLLLMISIVYFRKFSNLKTLISFV
jgi:O-antigen/teichoic acid export membrane protein